MSLTFKTLSLFSFKQLDVETLANVAVLNCPPNAWSANGRHSKSFNSTSTYAIKNSNVLTSLITCMIMMQRCFFSVKIVIIHVKTALDLTPTNALSAVQIMSAVLLRTESPTWEHVHAPRVSQIPMATVSRGVSSTWLEEEEIFVTHSVHRIPTHSCDSMTLLKLKRDLNTMAHHKLIVVSPLIILSSQVAIQEKAKVLQSRDLLILMKSRPNSLSLFGFVPRYFSQSPISLAPSIGSLLGLLSQIN